MLTVSEALDRAQMLCAAATKAGADAADALYYCNAATSVSMRLGALEDVERSEGQDISLRVFVGQRSASVSTADMDAGELTKLVERCVAMAREAPEDSYAGLAPEELLFKGPVPDLDLDDGSEADPAALRAAAPRKLDVPAGVAVKLGRRFDLWRSPVLVGLVSHNAGRQTCGVNQKQGVYTRIAAYRGWITGYVGRLPAPPQPARRRS